MANHCAEIMGPNTYDLNVRGGAVFDPNSVAPAHGIILHARVDLAADQFSGGAAAREGHAGPGPVAPAGAVLQAPDAAVESVGAAPPSTQMPLLAPAASTVTLCSRAADWAEMQTAAETP